LPSPASRPDARRREAKAPAKIPVRAVPVGNKGYLTVTTNVPTTVFIDDSHDRVAAPVNRLSLAPAFIACGSTTARRLLLADAVVTIKGGKSETLPLLPRVVVTVGVDLDAARGP